MKKLFLPILFLSVLLGNSGCSLQKVLEDAGKVINNGQPVTENEIILGLKQALEVGIGNGADIVSVTPFFDWI